MAGMDNVAFGIQKSNSKYSFIDQTYLEKKT